MKFSIVIPNYNGAHLLENNLPKVLEAAEGQQVIVVDDASTDGSVKLLKAKFPRVDLIENPQNLRFARACNRGVESAKNEVIVLLNSDVWPEKDFLDPLTQHFRDERVFAVGCMEIINAHNRGKSTAVFEKGLLVHADVPDRKAGPTFWAFGGSAAFDRKKWETLGGMDELFRPAYWEDIDLSYRAWKRGWEVLFEPKSRVHHEPESTNVNAFGRERIRRIASKNQILFVWKNIHDPGLFQEHLMWMPLQLLKSLLKGDGALIKGFLLSLGQLAEVLRARSDAKKHVQRSDSEILQKFSVPR